MLGNKSFSNMPFVRPRLVGFGRIQHLLTKPLFGNGLKFIRRGQILGDFLDFFRFGGVNSLSELLACTLVQLTRSRKTDIGVDSNSQGFLFTRKSVVVTPVLTSRLIGHRVQVRLYSAYVEVDYNGERVARIERVHGRGAFHVDYRHVIHSLVRKPGAFQRYVYREALFPALVFRRCYDTLCERAPSGADLEYLRILQLAATTMESVVASALTQLLSAGELYKQVQSAAVGHLVRSGFRFGLFDRCCCELLHSAPPQLVGIWLLPGRDTNKGTNKLLVPYGFTLEITGLKYTP